MGIVRDIFEIFDRDTLNIENGFRKRYDNYDGSNSSIARKAADGILQFPLLVTRSISYDTAMLITKACEITAASFAQIVLTMNPDMDISNNKGASEYLRRFHSNIDTTDDVFGNAMHFINADDTKEAFTEVLITDNNGIKVAEEDLREYGIDFRTGNLNSLAFENITERRIKKYTPSEIHSILQKHLNVITEAKKDNNNDNNNDNRNKKNKDNDNNKKDKKEKITDRISKTQDEIKLQKELNKLEKLKKEAEDDSTDKLKRYDVEDGIKLVDTRDVLMDTDVKKANELTPILLHIRVIAREGDKSAGRYVDFVIGVKATMHPIASEEMIGEITDACRYHDEVFRFIRWTTGEISFFKDLILNLRDSKSAVSREQGGGSPWWNRLKRMRALANIKARFFLSNRMLPNTTIVITQQEVDYIKNTFGFNLNNPKFVEDVMHRYYLLTFCIVDESAEVAHFKYDGQYSFATYSFSGLSRENNAQMSQFKEMLKAIQRM